jgi:hypothetical protein
MTSREGASPRSIRSPIRSPSSRSKTASAEAKSRAKMTTGGRARVSPRATGESFRSETFGCGMTGRAAATIIAAPMRTTTAVRAPTSVTPAADRRVTASPPRAGAARTVRPRAASMSSVMRASSARRATARANPTAAGPIQRSSGSRRAPAGRTSHMARIATPTEIGTLRPGAAPYRSVSATRPTNRASASSRRAAIESKGPLRAVSGGPRTHAPCPMWRDPSNAGCNGSSP